MMTFATILNVTIGLALTYLVISLIVTAAQELLAAFFGLRAATLKRGIATLLDQTVTGTKSNDLLFNRVFGHGLVGQLSPNGKPFYVPVRNLTLALLDVLKDGSKTHEFAAIEQGVALLPNGPVRQSLSVLLNEAAGDVDLLKGKVDAWFDNSMDRISGIYKRKTQAIAIGLGLVLTVALNVDSLNIAKTLWHSLSSDAVAQTAAARGRG